MLNLRAMGEDEVDEFFIYCNILDQVLVFQRCITDVTPSSVVMAQVLSSAVKSTPPQSATKIPEITEDPIMKQLNSIASQPE